MDNTDKKLGYAALQTTLQNLGYRFFDEGDYNLNLIGIRSADTNANRFNDHFAVAWRFDNKPHCLVFPCTTDPGLYWRTNPVNINGTAIVVPGQYPRLWQLGLHKGVPALVQRGQVQVYRDNDCDETLDLDAPVEAGHFGINCHRANAQHSSQRVDQWSAGCQVLANPKDFALLYALCERAAENWGGSFTYTLLKAEEL